VIHLAKKSHVKIAEVPGNHEIDDLPGAVWHRFVPRRPSGEHDVNVLGPIPLSNEVFLAGYLPNVSAKICYPGPILGIEIGQRAEPFNERWINA
jgi:hypothetical protein